jgi:hypothetical protein
VAEHDRPEGVVGDGRKDHVASQRHLQACEQGEHRGALATKFFMSTAPRPHT